MSASMPMVPARAVIRSTDSPRTARGSAPVVRRLTPSDHARLGLAARTALPPREQAHLVLPSQRRDPVALLEEQARSRVPELVPVRYGRMTVSPFAFFCGNAAGMATDLAVAPVSGLGVQLCGDAHLANFGVFGTPGRRRLLFDVNDFDETMAGPWEWDVKRLAVSLAVAGRCNGFGRKERRKCVLEAVHTYRRAIAEFGTMHALDVWYARADVDDVTTMLRAKTGSSRRKNIGQALPKARGNESLKSFAKLTEMTDDGVRIKADPPLLVPIADYLPEAGRDELEAGIKDLLNLYRRSLPTERRVLFDQFEVVDAARNVVGVSSVGTRSWIVLLRGRDDGDALLLQVKEAGPSALKAKVPTALRQRPAPRNDGERVVAGQRLMQATGDILLGWRRTEGIDGQARDFYVRQLRDMKGAAVVPKMDPAGMTMYGQLCGWTLARAHARSGDRIALATYLGGDDAFPDAMAEYAEAYADQNERDYQVFMNAVQSGRLEVETGL
ncbi:DUF2252 domain-containing protein [Kribbella sp. NPDC003505]|uniref:DUF2252 domain-containing protein n=1 Tax=Kribbella sp. NPDC003505 TaxID=3154448 RepID=UPI0033B5EE44